MMLRVYAFLASRKFRTILFVFIALQAMYIAITYAYPMLYDENYHYEIIKEFTHHWLPWITNQPVVLDNFGALERTPQLLFHYLLSFPLRVITLFTDNLAVNVIFLRLINIGLFILGLYLSAKLLAQFGVSKIVQNVTIAFVGMLPVSVFLAATINYDNLLFPLIIYTLIVANRIVKNKEPVVLDYLKLSSVLVAGSLTKISYLPVILGVVAYLAINLYPRLRRGNFLTLLKKNFHKTPKWPLYITGGVFVTLLVIFTQSFIGNIVLYRSLSPPCSVQLDISRCGNSTLERRDRHFVEIRSGVANQLPKYLVDWYGTMQRDALSVNTPRVTSNPADVDALPIIYLIVSAGILIALFGVIANIRDFMKKKEIRLFLLVFFVYICALIYTNMRAYYTTYIPLGIQSRYILLFMLIIAGLGLYGIAEMVKARKTSLKVAATCLVLVVYIWGGAGVVTYVSRSTTEWYWDNGILRTYAGKIKQGMQPYVKEGWNDRS